MDVLEAELAVLVSETEEEVVNNPDDGIAIPSRSVEPHCPIMCMYSRSYDSPLLFVHCHLKIFGT